MTTLTIPHLKYPTRLHDIMLRHTLSGAYFLSNYFAKRHKIYDVSKLDMSVSLLGEKVAFPVGVAPMGTQRLARDDGVEATASDM